MAESVDALDLKSNRGSPSVPVQVWPGANLKRELTIGKFPFGSFSLICIGFQDSYIVSVDIRCDFLRHRCLIIGRMRQILSVEICRTIFALLS